MRAGGRSRRKVGRRAQVWHSGYMTAPWTATSARADTFVSIAASRPQATLLAFDFDGTLAPIVDNPDEARILPATSSALQRLAAAGFMVAIISGRPVDTLLGLADLGESQGIDGATIFGQYGAQRFDVGTGAFSSPPEPDQVKVAKRELEALSQVHVGSTVEDKGLAVALHTRNCADPDAVFAAVEDTVRHIANSHDLTVEPGRYVWELRASSVTKGDALRTLVEEKRPDALMYAGDDLGDVAAFRYLTRAEASGCATCALVSSSSEVANLARYADVLCDGPAGVAAWLDHLVAVEEATETGND